MMAPIVYKFSIELKIFLKYFFLYDFSDKSSDIQITCVPEQITLNIPECVLSSLNMNSEELRFTNETQECMKTYNKVHNYFVNKK